MFFRGLAKIAREFPDVSIIFPMHKNPQVRLPAEEILGSLENVELIEPLDVLDFHNFAAHSYLVLTDSGGVQEEAPSLGVPVFVLRDTTERPEGVAAGVLKLIGTNETSVYEETKNILLHPEIQEEMSQKENPYGDGHASERIVEIISAAFSEVKVAM